MKKFTSFVLLAAMMAALLSLSSCAKEPKEKEPENTAQPETQATPTTPAPVVTYTVTIADGITNGTVTASKTSGIAEGETITLTITPATDYELDTISAGTGVTLNGTGNTRTFAMPAANVTVTATFKWKWVGTKNPTTAKEVGDIVFNDGSSMYFSDFEALDDAKKNTKKSSAIALIFYKGTGLNSGSDTTTSRTLGVGLKHGKDTWCWYKDNSNNANAYNKKIDDIQCDPDDPNVTAINYTWTGNKDRDGSNNLEQIGSWLADPNKGNSIDDTETEANYPAFYFAKNYATQKIGNETESRIAADSAYASGWYLPSIAELFQMYVNGNSVNKVFEIDEVMESLGGDQFGSDAYWSSSQYYDYWNNAYLANIEFGTLSFQAKMNSNHLCAIRAFN